MLLVQLIVTVFTATTTVASGNGLRFDHVSVTDMDSIFSVYNTPDSPGCAVGVVHDGELIFSGGYGIANLDYGIPIRPDSRFMIASISKQFAAAALLMLEQEGKLDLDEDIRRHIPEISHLNRPVTARQLMHHTSGIRDIYHLLTLADTGLDNTTTSEQALEMFSRQQRLNFIPGNEYLYSNSGYFLLSILVKNVSGMSLREYSHKHFFEPIGMNATHWHDDTEEIVPHRVISYRPMPFGPGRFYRDNMDRVGARGLFTTVEDMAKWDANFRVNRSNLQNFSEKMLRPGYTNRGGFVSYASGLRLGRYKTLGTVGHSGSYMGFRTSYMRFRRYDFSVIVFCNMSSINPDVHARQVADLYLKEVFDAQFRNYQGVYRNESLQAAFEVKGENGDLYLQRMDRLTGQADSVDRRRMLWLRDDQFRAGNWNLVFERGPGGQYDRFILESPRTGKITFFRD
jgi:CubicO group peptidase (beta-lactamase class C family)